LFEVVNVEMEGACVVQGNFVARKGGQVRKARVADMYVAKSFHFLND